MQDHGSDMRHRAAPVADINSRADLDCVAGDGPTTPGASTEISGRELLAFAKSYLEFDKIRTVAELQLNVARTPREKSRIEQLALAKFGAALEREGLTMARYGALYQKISANDRLREKVRKLIDEEQAKS